MFRIYSRISGVYNRNSITNPNSLNVAAAMAGLAVITVIAGVLIYLIKNADRRVKAEYASDSSAQKGCA